MARIVHVLTFGALVSASLLAAAPVRAADTMGAPAAPLAPVRANGSFTMNALLGYVNSQPMFVGDLLRPIDEDLRRMARQGRDIADFKAGARAAIESQMRRQIKEVLVFSAAKATLADEDKQRIDIFLNKQKFELLSKYGGSQALADQALRAVGTSVEKDLEDKRRELTVQLYLHKQLWPRVVVTRQMVLEEYEKDPKKWAQEAELELFTIRISFYKWLKEPDPDRPGESRFKPHPTAEEMSNAEAAALARARELMVQIKSGADWARLAEDNSSDTHAKDLGGRWPNVRKGSLSNEKVEELAFSLPANTVGEPLIVRDADPTKSSVMIIKVGQKKDARVVSFADAQEDIKARLWKKQFDDLSEAYLNKLYKDAAVEEVDKMVEVAVDAAISRYATGAEGK